MNWRKWLTLSRLSSVDLPLAGVASDELGGHLHSLAWSTAPCRCKDSGQSTTSPRPGPSRVDCRDDSTRVAHDRHPFLPVHSCHLLMLWQSVGFKCCRNICFTQVSDASCVPELSQRPPWPASLPAGALAGHHDMEGQRPETGRDRSAGTLKFVARGVASMRG